MGLKRDVLQPFGLWIDRYTTDVRRERHYYIVCIAVFKSPGFNKIDHFGYSISDKKLCLLYLILFYDKGFTSLYSIPFRPYLFTSSFIQYMKGVLGFLLFSVGKPGVVSFDRRLCHCLDSKNNRRKLTELNTNYVYLF